MSNKSMLGGVLLIVGTSIGGGMLALPVATAQEGFIPATVMLFLTWAVMTIGALLILEVNLWLPEDSNLVSMAGATLGKLGQGATWVVYLMLLYALLSAYVAGGSDILSGLIASLHVKLPHWLDEVLFVVILGSVVYTGIKSVDYVNRMLMFGKLIVYLILVLALMPHIQLPNILHHNNAYMISTVTIMITSYGYATVIPSLRSYYHSDAAKLRKMVIIGSAIPLVAYIAWEVTVLGVIPLTGTQGLLHVLQQGNTNTALTSALGYHIHKLWIYEFWRLFTTICVATSFLGVSLCLSDFLADGLSMPKRGKNKWIIYMLTFVPPMLLVFAYPSAFLMALDYAGVLCVLLLVLLPTLMAWSGRYRKNIATGEQVFGGKATLITMLLLSVVLIYIGFQYH